VNEYVTIEKEQGAVGLVLGRRGDLSIHGQMGEKGFDFRRAHVARMTLVVEENETFDPIDVGFFGADGVVLESDGVSYLVEYLLWGMAHVILLAVAFSRMKVYSLL